MTFKFGMGRSHLSEKLFLCAAELIPPLTDYLSMKG